MSRYPITKKLYYENSYLKEIKSDVLDIIEKDGKIFAILDQTIFYPAGGGQPSDTGYLDGAAVVDVTEKDGVIYHELSEMPKEVFGISKLDFHTRFDHMQQHSGEHVLSGVILSLFGGANKGFHMGEKYVTIDIDMKDMSEDMIEAAEKETNQHIYSNEKVEKIFTDMDNLANYPIRKQISAQDDIRVIRMGQADCCACCGTHVDYLGEIGIVKVLKTEAYKGMTRIYFVCGQRALRDYTQKSDIVKNLKSMLSSEEELITEKVQKLKDDIILLKKESDVQKKKYADLLLDSHISDEENLFLLLDDIDSVTAGYIVSAAHGKAKNVVIGSGEDDKIIASTTDDNIDIGGFFKHNLKMFSARGGGSKSRAQAGFNSHEDLKGFFELLRIHIVNESSL